MTPKLIALAQHAARIVIGAEATPAEIHELTQTMSVRDWRDLAEGDRLGTPSLQEIGAARDYLALTAAVDREAGLLAI